MLRVVLTIFLLSECTIYCVMAGTSLSFIHIFAFSWSTSFSVFFDRHFWPEVSDVEKFKWVANRDNIRTFQNVSLQKIAWTLCSLVYLLKWMLVFDHCLFTKLIVTTINHAHIRDQQFKSVRIRALVLISRHLSFNDFSNRHFDS